MSFPQTKAALNRRFKAEGLPVELVKGDGYFYYVFDDGALYDTHSVMVYAFGHDNPERWYTTGVEFAARVRAEAL